MVSADCSPPGRRSGERRTAETKGLATYAGEVPFGLVSNDFTSRKKDLYVAAAGRYRFIERVQLLLLFRMTRKRSLPLKRPAGNYNY